MVRLRSPDRAVRFAVTSHRSRLYHTDAIAERFARVFGRDVDDDADDAQLFVIRFDRDVCTVSADTSGRPLHQRGWRLATAKAPLRPTLAAAVLLSCGSGARLLGGEAAAARSDVRLGHHRHRSRADRNARAPGAGREFSFQQWPSFEPGTWASVRASLRATRDLLSCSTIVAGDRDAGAIESTIANAERAGVADLIRTHVSALTETGNSTRSATPRRASS